MDIFAEIFVTKDNIKEITKSLRNGEIVRVFSKNRGGWIEVTSDIRTRSRLSVDNLVVKKIRIQETDETIIREDVDESNIARLTEMPPDSFRVYRQRSAGQAGWEIEDGPIMIGDRVLRANPGKYLGSYDYEEDLITSCGRLAGHP